MKGHLFYFIFFKLISTSFSIYFTNQCPQYCSCDLTKNILYFVSCTQTDPFFKLPYYPPDLTNTSSIIAYNSYLLHVPSNICQFSATLRILDISFNLITDNLTSTSFGCLTSLEFLNISKNALQIIDADTFTPMNALQILDLSYNLLTYLPNQLFNSSKLQNLKIIYLNNNFLTDIDVWFFYLKSIVLISLNGNKIAQFTNRIGYNPSLNLSIPFANLIDLRNNQIKQFDDQILSAYSICQPLQLLTFLSLMSSVLLTQNPIGCSCSAYNMLNFYQALINQNLLPSASTNILNGTKCSTLSSYLGSSAFSFLSNPNTTCSSTINAASVVGCQIITTTTLRSVSILNPNNPELLLGDPDQPFQAVSQTPTDGQIAGIVVGFLAVFILILILLYCICPIEILACLFGIFPSFYTICPCKSGAVTSKKYDLFISYNKSCETWIQTKLVPFFQEKNPIHSYFLQYGGENIEQEDFNSNIQEAMNNSACTLLVLSDEYLIKEWTNQEFKNHLRNLLTKVSADPTDRHRLVVIQMSDVCDEEVDDYVRTQLQLPRFISLENDEFCFWTKLNYFLHTNNVGDVEKVLPINFANETNRANVENIDFEHYHIKAPIVHLPPRDQVKRNVFTIDSNQLKENIDLKRQVLIKNKQRIKVAKELLRRDSIDDSLDNVRIDSPTDFAKDLIKKRGNSKIKLGKIKKDETAKDTKIKVEKTVETKNKPEIELNIVRKESRNIQYGISNDYDYTADIKSNNNKEETISMNSSSLKMKSVRFNKDLEINQVPNKEQDNEDYQHMLNEIENEDFKKTMENNSKIGKSSIKTTTVTKSQSIENNYSDSLFD